MMAAAIARPINTDGNAKIGPDQWPRAEGQKLTMPKPTAINKPTPPMSIVNLNKAA